MNVEMTIYERVFVTVYVVVFGYCIFAAVESWPFTNFGVFTDARQYNDLVVYV